MEEIDNTYDVTGQVGYYYEGDKLVAPETVVPNATAAYAMYNAMRESHVRRVLTYSRIQGLIDGNPPYSKEVLRKRGLETQSNVNWRDAEAYYEFISLTFWSLFNEVKNIATISTTFGAPESLADYSDVLSEEFNKILRDWDDFDAVMSEHQADFVKFGMNVLFWKDERDWKYESGDVFRVLFPEKTRNSTKDISCCAIEHAITAQQLFDIYENAPSDYWNKDAIAQTLAFKANRTQDDYLYSSQYIAEIQRKIRNGDLTIDDIYNDDIMLVTIFVREADNTVSRVMIPIDMEGAVTDFLYKSHSQYADMRHALQIFTFTPGEKYVHGVKGVGHKMYNVMEGLSQIDNSLMDGVRRSQTVLVKTKTGRNKDMKQIRFTHGGFVDIGESEFIQNLMGANLAPSVDVANYFRQKLEFNNNISGTSPNRDPKPKTYGEVRAQVTKEAKVQKNRIAHYYRQLDKLFNEVLRKMLSSKSGYPGYEEVELFKQRCILRGVPPEVFVLTKDNEGQNGLPEHMCIRATRASGSGSQTADQMEMQSTADILPILGVRGKQAWLRDYVAAFRGFEYVDRYLPPEDVGDEPTNQDTLASIENNQLEKGEMVVVSPDNVHSVHAQRHINRLKQLTQIFNEAVDTARQDGITEPYLAADQYGQYSLEELDVAFQTLGPHLVRHIIFLQRDPTQQGLLQTLLPEWNVLANFGDKIAKNAQDHRLAKLREIKKEQEQMQQQIPSEERVAMAKIESDARVKEAKLNSEIRRNATRDQLRYQLDLQKITYMNDVNKAKAISDIANKRAKTMSEIEMTKGKEETEIV